ncbi:integral component of membrane [Sergentomyia squamirostris]
MSTAKRLVLTLRGRKDSQGASAGASSSTRLVSTNSSSPGHELDEIAVVSGNAGECGNESVGCSSFGSLGGQANGPRLVPGECSNPN